MESVLWFVYYIDILYYIWQKILDTEQVYCMQLYECEESTTLLVGTQSGAVILWDGASFTIRNM